MRQDPHRWLLEYNSLGDTYTESASDEGRIRDVIDFFDGSTVFYCCLFDNDSMNESCLWCYGEPDRRVIEGRAAFHFVVKDTEVVGNETVPLRYGMEADQIVKVQQTEVLSAADATAVFLTFYQDMPFLNRFERVRKAYLFG